MSRVRYSDHHQVDEIMRARRCITGWRYLLNYSRELIDDLASLKGSQAFRGRIEHARHELRQSLLASDLEVLRNTTSTAELAIALVEADKLAAGRPWMMGRGMSRRGSTSYQLAIFGDVDDDEPLVDVSHEEPRQCVGLAVRKLEAARPALAVAS